MESSEERAQRLAIERQGARGMLLVPGDATPSAPWTLRAPLPLLDEEVFEFKQRLAEAIGWCSHRFDALRPDASLRTPGLRPAGALLDEGDEVVQETSERERLAAVADVAQKRRAALEAAGLKSPQALEAGRLLAFFMDESLSEGDGAALTGGFLDVHAAPAWDTWVWYVPSNSAQAQTRGMLLAWIPPEMLLPLHRAVWSNVTACIRWADAATLRAVGLVR